MTSTALAADLLWRNAWAVLPLAAVVMLACACVRFRPATRHTLWLIVLLGLVVPLILPALPVPGVVENVLSAARESGEASCTAAPAVDAPSPNPSLRGRGAGTPAVYVPSPNPSLRGRGVSVPSPDPSLSGTEATPAAEMAAVPGDEQLWTLGDSAEPSPPPAWIEPCVSAELPATPGSVEPRPAPFDHAPGRLGPAAAAVPAVDPAARDNPIEPWNSGAAPRVDSPRGDDAAGTSVESGRSRWWQPWLVGLIGVWDALGRLPRIPLTVWVGGIALLGVWHLGWMLHFLRRLRGATAAPPGVQRMVDEAAAELGLRRAPTVLMVAGCLSPMVWCGHGLRLILPMRLWGQLDAAGRKAILYHELAHVRRRDPWVCWLGLLVGTLYWWHPVVWWARRRLHEEADLCCDAWVTWLMPQRRRQYAEALLATKVFIGGRGPLVPAGGMGATSVGARRFARRLTMVMTTSARPGLSRPGVVLAAVVALVGWMTVPGWATPDRPPPTTEKAKTKVEIVPAVPDVPEPDAVDEVVDSALEGKLQQLEEELTALSEQLAELRGWQGRTPRPPRAVRAPRAVTLPSPPTVTTPAPPAAPTAPSWEVLDLATGVPGGLGGYFAMTDDDEEVVRSYELPEGKLGALAELMKRDDVPVRVSVRENCIEVHGTALQQRRFAAFVELIHPTGQAEVEAGGYAGPQAGRAREAYEAAAEQRAEALAKLYAGRGGGWTRNYGEAQAALQEALRAHAGGRQGSLHGQIAALNALVEQLNAQMQGREERSTALMAEAEALNEQAAEVEARAEELVERANEVAERANETEDRTQARALEAEARGLERQARELERQARMLERRAQEAEQAAEKMESDAEELDQSAEQLREALNMLGAVSQTTPTPCPAPAPTPCPTPLPTPEPAGAVEETR